MYIGNLNVWKVYIIKIVNVLTIEHIIITVVSKLN
jgi:hypothetical protein